MPPNQPLPPTWQARARYSRPDVFTRAWRAAGYSLHKLPSGRIRVAVSDFKRFMQGKPAERQAS